MRMPPRDREARAISMILAVRKNVSIRVPTKPTAMRISPSASGVQAHSPANTPTLPMRIRSGCKCSRS
jgi:hypothetical protein